jgi:hypothetical protein
MIRRFKNVSARTKILLFAFLFIIVPSGILGYLGFRSIGNRGVTLKENCRSMARLMREEFEGELAGLESRFVREALDQEWTGSSQEARLLLGELRNRHPAIAEAFLVDSDGALILGGRETSRVSRRSIICSAPAGALLFLPVPPFEANPPLVVHSYRIFAFPFPRKPMEPVSRRHLQIHEAYGRVQNQQLPSGGSQEGRREPAGRPAQPNPFRIFVSERYNHVAILSRHVIIVKPHRPFSRHGGSVSSSASRADCPLSGVISLLRQVPGGVQGTFREGTPESGMDRKDSLLAPHGLLSVRRPDEGHRLLDRLCRGGPHHRPPQADVCRRETPSAFRLSGSSGGRRRRR